LICLLDEISKNGYHESYGVKADELLAARRSKNLEDQTDTNSVYKSFDRGLEVEHSLIYHADQMRD
jgi:hypothetical protein